MPLIGLELNCGEEGGCFPAGLYLESRERKKVGGKMCMGPLDWLATRSLYPLFSSLWHMGGDGTVGLMVTWARTHSTVGLIYAAKKIQQKIHVIKPPILAWVVNVKSPSLTLLTVHLILKAELIYASMCWEIDAISMILKNHFNNHHHLHVWNVLSIQTFTVQDVSHALRRLRPWF